MLFTFIEAKECKYLALSIFVSLFKVVNEAMHLLCVKFLPHNIIPKKKWTGGVKLEYRNMEDLEIWECFRIENSMMGRSD